MYSEAKYRRFIEPCVTLLLASFLTDTGVDAEDSQKAAKCYICATYDPGEKQVPYDFMDKSVRNRSECWSSSPSTLQGFARLCPQHGQKLNFKYCHVSLLFKDLDKRDEVIGIQRGCSVNPTDTTVGKCQRSHAKDNTGIVCICEAEHCNKFTNVNVKMFGTSSKEDDIEPNELPPTTTTTTPHSEDTTSSTTAMLVSGSGSSSLPQSGGSHSQGSVGCQTSGSSSPYSYPLCICLLAFKLKILAKTRRLIFAI